MHKPFGQHLGVEFLEYVFILYVLEDHHLAKSGAIRSVPHNLWFQGAPNTHFACGPLGLAQSPAPIR